MKQLGRQKKTDAVAVADENVKKGGRQAARLRRIEARTAREDTKPPSVSKERQDNRWLRILSRMSPEDTTPPSVPPTMEREQDEQDDEDMTPGAVRVPGTIDSVPREDEEDGLTMVSEHDSTIVGASDLHHETSTATSTRMILQAQLVEEDERERIEEEMRQKFLREIGQVAQAEVVEADGTKSRRRALLCIGIVVILMAIILGSVLATRDTSTNNTVFVPVTVSMTPTVSSVPSEIPSEIPSETPSNTLSDAPSETPSEPPTFRPSPSPSMKPSLLNNSLCEEPLPIILGGDGVEGSLQSATEQVVVFCEDPGQRSESQPGLWYNVRGVGVS
jgi:hypothetical protein